MRARSASIRARSSSPMMLQSGGTLPEERSDREGRSDPKNAQVWKNTQDLEEYSDPEGCPDLEGCSDPEEEIAEPVEHFPVTPVGPGVGPPVRGQHEAGRVELDHVRHLVEVAGGESHPVRGDLDPGVTGMRAGGDPDTDGERFHASDRAGV